MNNKQPTIDDLIASLQSEMSEVNLSGIKPNTIILDIEGWNSLHSLILMAFTSTEYDVELSAQDIQAIKTVQDLHNVINERRSRCNG